MRIKRNKISQLKKNILCAKQNWSCNICKNLFKELFIFDHIVPLFLGGEDSIGNIQVLCPSCDKYKTSYIDKKILKNIKKITKKIVLREQFNNINKFFSIKRKIIRKNIINKIINKCKIINNKFIKINGIIIRI